MAFYQMKRKIQKISGGRLVDLVDYISHPDSVDRFILQRNVRRTYSSRLARLYQRKQIWHKKKLERNIIFYCTCSKFGTYNAVHWKKSRLVRFWQVSLYASLVCRRLSSIYHSPSFHWNSEALNKKHIFILQKIMWQNKCAMPLRRPC